MFLPSGNGLPRKGDNLQGAIHRARVHLMLDRKHCITVNCTNPFVSGWAGPRFLLGEKVAEAHQSPE